LEDCEGFAPIVVLGVQCNADRLYISLHEHALSSGTLLLRLCCFASEGRNASELRARIKTGNYTEKDF
jgi:hypothetical protein